MKIILNKLILIILAMVLSGCDAFEGSCLYPASPGGNNIKQNFKVRADGNYNTVNATSGHTTIVTQDTTAANSGKWLPTDINVINGQVVNILTEGIVSMCQSIGVGQASTTTPPGIPIAVDSRNYFWTDPKIQIHKGDKLTIWVGEPNDCGDTSNTYKCANSDTSCNNQASTIYSNNCGGGSYSTACNKWSTWNGKNGPIAWDKKSISANSASICTTEGCTKTSSQAGWNIRGYGLYAQIAPTTPVSSATDMSRAISLANPSNPIYSDDATQPITVPTTSNGQLLFRILDCNTCTTCYNNNMGGYTVYVQNFACPAYNGVKNSVVNSGDLKVLVTSGDPNSSTPNGQYLSNLQGDNTITGVIGSGQIWLKINDNVYTDNTGEYNVDITIKSGSKTAGMFSSMIMGLVNMIKDLLFVKNVSSQDWSVLGSQSTNSQIIGQNLIYTRLTCSGLSDKTHCFDYIKTLRAMLTLYIIFYSISFLFGLINPTQIDLVIRIIKIGVIITLTSDRSWSFFNDIFFKLFVDGGAQLINAINGNGTSSSNPFAFADTIMQYLLFDDKAIIRLLAILFTSTVGPLYFCLILYGAYVLLGEIFKAACAYIMSFVAIAILISLAPIFIPCILFSLTRHLFDNWIKFLVRYTLEPVLLLGGLGILSQLLLVALGQIFSFAVCWKCAFPITFGLPIPNFPSSLKVFCINFFQPWGYDNMGGGMGIKSTVLGMFTEILFFLIIISAIKKYCQFSKTLAMMLTGSVDAPAVSGGESAGGNIAHSISEGLKTPFGLDEKSKDRRSLANSKEENKAEAKIKEAKEGAQNNPAGKGGNNNAPVVARGGNNLPPVGGGGDND